MESGKTEAGSSAVEEARALLQRNLPAEAARLLEDHLAQRAGSANEYLLLGVARAQSGEGLTAIQALEQAIALEPGNAAAHFNLGQVVRQGGRLQEALKAYERALELRPNYPVAQTAATELRQRLAPPPPAATSAPASPPSTRRGESPWPPNFGPTPVSAEAEPPVAEQEGLFRRLLRAMWQLVGSPGEAMEFGLDNFYNTPGAIRAVYQSFTLSVIVAAFLAWLTPSERGGTESAGLASSIPFAVFFSVVSVIVAAAFIAGYNRLTGETNDFTGDFGSLALSFALIAATITLLVAPVHLVMLLAGATSGARFLSLVGGLWTFVLQMFLVMVMAGLNVIAAFVLLVLANIVGVVGALMIALLFVGGA